MGHFGFQLPEAIRGTVGSTANKTIRTGVASEDIEFGAVLELTNRTPVFDGAAGKEVKPYIDTLDALLPMLGVAIYKDNSSGVTSSYKYKAGDVVSYATEGDVYMFVSIGSVCLLGDPCYLAFNAGTWFATDQVTGRRIGTFAESKVATADNSVLVSLNIQLPVLVV